MARRTRQDSSAAGVVIVALAGVALLIFIFKTLLITAAILVVPFGVWWVLDYRKRKAADAAAQSVGPPINPEHEAQMAELYDMPDSAAFWRSQPPSELLPDEVEWRARVERDHQRRLREQG